MDIKVMNIKHLGRIFPSVLVLFVCIPGLLFLCSGCFKMAPRPDLPPYDPGTLVGQSGQPLSDDLLQAKLSQAGYILIGETHTNPCDHQVQARVIELLQNRGVEVAVGLEMVPAGMQAVLDRFNAGSLGLDELEKALEWKRIWGHDFALYRPVFQAVARAGISLHGLNLKQGLLQSLREKGFSGLSPEERENLPERIIPVPEEQKESLLEQFEEHQEFMNDKGVKADQERFLRVQALWDTQMAVQATKVRGRTGQPVVILCGTGHVEYGWGVPHRLKILDPEASVLTIVPWRGGQNPDAAAGDVFYLCPPQHRSRLGFTMEFKTLGVEIVEVREGSRAAKAGMKPGDVLEQVGGEPLEEILDLHHAAIKAMKSDKPLSVTVERGGQDIDLGLELEKPQERTE